jgi:hypothetical protein
MKAGRLIAFVGAAIVASSSAPLAGASVASAATVPAVPSYNIPFDVGGGCEGLATINDYDAGNQAFVDAFLDSDPCHVGVEGCIATPGYTTLSCGADIHNEGDNSTTGFITPNSGNHHGIRWWNTDHWQYNWHD